MYISLLYIVNIYIRPHPLSLEIGNTQIMDLTSETWDAMKMKHTH